ncbi:hypothetical protein [Phaeacidiphilus oryzae]|uniref:hypothetical protein n=1 Tax=Phaeacidiphilus oryzae TaxID=348818 RepID=UPI00126A2844|nr:hypothetical protein [Phaeacidiphilus oryzae]
MEARFRNRRAGEALAGTASAEAAAPEVYLSPRCRDGRHEAPPTGCGGRYLERDARGVPTGRLAAGCECSCHEERHARLLRLAAEEIAEAAGRQF